MLGNRDGVVCVVTRSQVGLSRNRCSFPSSERGLSLLQSVQTGPVPVHHSILCILLRVKQPEREAAINVI
jgi:hypothetical protein